SFGAVIVFNPAFIRPSLRCFAQPEKAIWTRPTSDVGQGMLPKIKSGYLEWRVGSYHIAVYNGATRSHWKRLTHGHDRSFRAHDQLFARVGHRPLRFPLHLLHGRGHGVPPQEGPAVARGTRPALHRLHREGRAQTAPHRRRAAGAQEHHASGAPAVAASEE